MSILPPKRTASRMVFAGFIALATVCGALVALQSRINGELGNELDDGFVAAVISFGSGLIVVAIVLASVPGGRAGLARTVRGLRAHEIPWWLVCGGAAGGLFVLSQGITVTILGIALFTVATVAGQTVSGLVLDARGIRHVAPKVITRTRLIGAVLALVAVVIAIGPEVNGTTPFLLLILPLIVGCFLGWQQAVNAQVKTYANSALTATFANFAAGTALLVIIAVVSLIFRGLPTSYPSNPFLYVGGIVGVLFIAGFAAATPVIGVLLQSLAAVSGQLIMSLVLDIVVPAPGATLAWTTVLGTLLTLVGVAIAALPSAPVRRQKEIQR